MLTMIKDLPFIDTVFPVLISIGIWMGANVLYIGPEVIGPRLAEKYYLPACHAGLTRIKAQALKKRFQKLAAQRRSKEDRKRKASKFIERFTTGIFGPEFAEHYKNHPFIKSMQDMAKMGIELEAPGITLPKSSQPSASYCNCIIDELLSQRMATGLYSASLRFWKGNNIRRLEHLEFKPVSSNTCGNPAKTKE